jgi:hypothetical protein
MDRESPPDWMKEREEMLRADEERFRRSVELFQWEVAWAKHDRSRQW